MFRSALVNLYTSDIEAGIRFYRDLLGFKETWADNVDRAYADVEAADVVALQPPHDTGNNNHNALLRDPDGNLVELVAKGS